MTPQCLCSQPWATAETREIPPALHCLLPTAETPFSKCASGISNSVFSSLQGPQSLNHELLCTGHCSNQSTEGAGHHQALRRDGQKLQWPLHCHCKSHPTCSFIYFSGLLVSKAQLLTYVLDFKEKSTQKDTYQRNETAHPLPPAAAPQVSVPGPPADAVTFQPVCHQTSPAIAADAEQAPHSCRGKGDPRLLFSPLSCLPSCCVSKGMDFSCLPPFFRLSCLQNITQETQISRGLRLFLLLLARFDTSCTAN